jgi:hypothetical protein
MSENQQTFFGEAGALEALSQAGDPLETFGLYRLRGVSRSARKDLYKE